MSEWNFIDAESRFDELVNRALNAGSQRVRYKTDTVIVISQDEYEGLLENKPMLKQHLMQGSHLDKIDLIRDRSAMRNVDL